MRQFIQNILNVLGVSLHRINGRGTFGGALAHLRAKGFRPADIIDGGASDGHWGEKAREYFPDAHYILVEPLAEHLPALQKIPNVHIVTSALADTEGEMIFHAINAFNSSLQATGGEERTVPTITLDSLLSNPQNTLLKLDLEGGEYMVLKSSNLLPQVPVVIVECVFSRLPQYCALMEEKGFAVYYIFDLNFDRRSGNMSQVDIVFVQKNSPLLK